MNLSAIKHVPMSADAHGISEQDIVFRLRSGRGDLQSCTLYYADRACRQTPVIFSCTPMQIVARDEWFDYYEVILKSPYKRICYYFELDDGSDKLLYYGDFFAHHRVEDRSEYFQLPFNHRADIVDIPEWAKNAVMYNIFPDSFATTWRSISENPNQCVWNGQTTHGKLGGTINGITENLDYIKDLGFNCIYLNPIFVAGEYHKYDLIDYFHIDPCFGTDDDFRRLVDTCHDKKIRVIVDGVFNHVGWYFFAFDDVVKNGEDSRYKDWFYGLTFPVRRPDSGEEYPNYECFGYERMMPKTNTENPEVVEYFNRVGQYWVKEFDIDGWRLDVASEINNAFWRSFRDAVKAVKPDCLLIGEVWESAQHWLGGDMFDSTMNYDFRKHCRRFFSEKAIDSAQFDGRVTNMRMRYKLPIMYGQLNLLDSHDVSRFFSLCQKDLARMKLAVLFQMTFIGIPSVFYGDEKGIEGLLEEEYRCSMPWAHEGSELECFYRNAIQLRNTWPELRHGNYHTVSAKTGSGLYAYARSLGKCKILILLNNQTRTAEIPSAFVKGQLLWQEGLNGKTIDPMGFAVFRQVTDI